MRRAYRAGWVGAVAAALVMMATAASGQSLADYDYEDLYLRGIGIDYGYMWPTKVQTTQTFGVRFDLGYLGPGIRLVPSVVYWSSQFTNSQLRELELKLDQIPGASVPPGTLEEVDWSDVAVNLDAHFVWTTPFNLLTYLGLGVGLHTLNGTSAEFEGTFVEDLLDTVTAGGNAIAGIELQPVSRLRIYAEARYTALADIQYAHARAGLAFMFGHRDPTVAGLRRRP
jgi:hypothetical protein